MARERDAALKEQSRLMAALERLQQNLCAAGEKSSEYTNLEVSGDTEASAGTTILDTLSVAAAGSIGSHDSKEQSIPLIHTPPSVVTWSPPRGMTMMQGESKEQAAQSDQRRAGHFSAPSKVFAAKEKTQALSPHNPSDSSSSPAISLHPMNASSINVNLSNGLSISKSGSVSTPSSACWLQSPHAKSKACCSTSALYDDEPISGTRMRYACGDDNATNGQDKDDGDVAHEKTEPITGLTHVRNEQTPHRESMPLMRPMEKTPSTTFSSRQGFLPSVEKSPAWTHGSRHSFCAPSLELNNTLECGDGVETQRNGHEGKRNSAPLSLSCRRGIHAEPFGDRRSLSFLSANLRDLAPSVAVNALEVGDAQKAEAFKEVKSETQRATRMRTWCEDVFGAQVSTN
jgi:hypothetical protein